jgi:hypothetical protein
MMAKNFILYHQYIIGIKKEGFKFGYQPSTYGLTVTEIMSSLILSPADLAMVSSFVSVLPILD